MRLLEGGNVEKHLEEMQDLVDKLAALGQNLDENLQLAMILGSLPDSFNSMVTALDTRPENELTLELVQNILLNDGKRRQGHESSDILSERAMQVNNSIECFFGHQKGHKKFKCPKWKSQKHRQFLIATQAEEKCDNDYFETQAYSAYSAGLFTGQCGR